MKKRILACLLALMICASLCGCMKSANVKQAEELIAAIGKPTVEVTADSGASIEAAEAAFDALSEKEREQVANVELLPRAREALEKAVEEKNEAERLAALETRRQGLIGRWDSSVDGIDQIVPIVDAIVESSYGLEGFSLADYVDSFEIHMIWKLRENGTWEMRVDEERLEDTLEEKYEGFIGYYGALYRVFTAGTLEQENGIYVEDPYDDNSWIYATGAAFPDLVQSWMGITLDEQLETLVDAVYDNLLVSLTGAAVGEGNYAVLDDRMLLSDSLDDMPTEDSYVGYTLEGESLRLNEQVKTQAFEGEQFPIDYQKID